jgi:hypothetical protein
MVYINSDGSVEQERTMWRLSIFSDIFWGIVNEVTLFVQTLISPTTPIPRRLVKNKSENSSSRLGGSNNSNDSNSGGGRKRPNIHTLPKQCTTNK